MSDLLITIIILLFLACVAGAYWIGQRWDQEMRDALVMRINGELALAPVGVTWDDGIEVVYVGRLGALDHEFFESPTPRERIVQAIRDGTHR